MPVSAAVHFAHLQKLLELEADAEARQIKGRTGQAAEKLGLALCSLVIRDTRNSAGGREKLIFGKRHLAVLPYTRFQAGAPVMLSEESNFKAPDTVWRGIVSSRDRLGIEVVFEEPPEPESDRATFRLDLSSDEVSRKRIDKALRRCVSAERGRIPQLRAVLLGEREPSFEPLKKFEPLSDSLNEVQLEAVRLALEAKDIAIIHGPPGTGKTTTVVELIRQAVARGEKVLACAPSNLGIDNLCEKLLDAGVDLTRLGHPARVLPEIQAHTLDVKLGNHPDQELADKLHETARKVKRELGRWTRAKPGPGERRDQREELRELLVDARRLEDQAVEHLLDTSEVLCATLTGLDEKMLGDRQFDLVVIDEAAQATELACWIPIQRAQRLVLAGDHCQLPATVISPEAAREGLGVSLMQRLIEDRKLGPKISRRLTIQFRMHESIMGFSSNEFYEGSLIAAPSVAGHTLSEMHEVETSDFTSSPLLFIDTAGAGYEEETGTDGESRFNPREASLVAKQVQALLDTGLSPEDIAVISPYAAQVRALREMLADCLDIDTIDGFQGREKEAVVISLVRSNTQGELGFLTDTRRLNVALTRARRKLIVIGDSATLASHPFFDRLMKYFEDQGAYHSVWEFGDV